MNIKSIVGTVALAGSLGLASVSALAFEDFTVDPGAYALTLVSLSPLVTTPKDPFVADKITGNYSEVITFTGLNTYAVSLQWSAGQFVANDGNTALTAATTGLNDSLGYSMYALFMGTGTFATVAGVTTFTADAGVGSLALWLDPNRDTTFDAPVNGLTAWSVTPGTADVLIATGTPSSGGGTLDPGLSTCNPGINCGSFGNTISFMLEQPAGGNFFTLPTPFYDVTFQSGQLNTFQLSGTQTINGSLDVVFGRVPEPATVALFASGLLGLGFAARRRRNKA